MSSSIQTATATSTSRTSDNRLFTINMEHIVQTKDIRNTHWRISSDPRDNIGDLYIISLHMERYEHFVGVYAYDMHSSYIVYIPLSENGLELDYSKRVYVIKVHTLLGGYLKFDDSHELYIPIISNYSCGCNFDHTGKYTYICMHCQIIRRELSRFTLKRALTVEEFMTYLYSHIETTYDNLISDIMNRHHEVADVDLTKQ
jgi:hypothetical protein